MNKIIVLILLAAPAFASAQDNKKLPSADELLGITKPKMTPEEALAKIRQMSAQAEAKKKTNVYKVIADELLKKCEGTDKKIAVAGFSYSDGRDSRDGGVVAERITTELVKLMKFKVIERKELEVIPKFS